MRSQYPRRGRRYGTILATAALLGVCGTTADSLPAQSELLDKNRQALPAAPAAGTGALARPVRDALASVVPSLQQRRFPADAIRTIGMSGDGRLLWYLYDLLRFVTRDSQPIVVEAFEALSSAELPGEPFAAMGDRVLAWDLPAPPGYRLLKRDLFLLIEPRWAPFFDDEDSAIDWRLVGWGGVFIDDRPDATAGQICPRGCIPALDQPAFTDAEGGSWYPDDDLVFGIVIDRQARAYPKNVMEVHEMVNDTLGGRSIAIPYCTLCLSAQAYFTDDVEGFQPLLRTSGCCRDPTSSCMTSPRSPPSTRLPERRSLDRCSTPASRSIKPRSLRPPGRRGARRTPTPRSSLRMEESAGATRATPCAAATTLGLSFQLGMSTRVSACTMWCWA